MAQRVEGAIEIEVPVETVYGYWETLENLPNFMANVQEVTPTGPDTTRWRVKDPLGRTLEWEAQTTQKEHNSVEQHPRRGGDLRRGALLGGGQSRAHPGRGADELLRPAGGQDWGGCLQGDSQPQAAARAGP